MIVSTLLCLLYIQMVTKLCLFLCLIASAFSVAPNIVVLLTDDQGFGDNSYYCQNSTGMCAHTPNLDALARSPNSALFHRFYAAAGVCSPTRASILTGRTNERDCIHFALPCDQEDPAPTCAMGRAGSLPWEEFSIAKAAKVSPLGDYATIQIGKWHLGDLWDKGVAKVNDPCSFLGNDAEVHRVRFREGGYGAGPLSVSLFPLRPSHALETNALI